MTHTPDEPPDRSPGDRTVARLTGLPTTPMLHTQLTSLQTANHQPDIHPVFIQFDIDRLIYYNDTFGPWKGDDLIRHVANTIQAALPGPLYQIGGDDFVCILDTMEQAQALADRVSTNIRHIPAVPYPVAYGHAQVYRSCYSVSIGITSWNPRTEAIETLWQRLETALVAVKQAGGNGWAVIQGEPSPHSG